MGAMTLVATFEQVPGGTDVTIACTDLPPGLRPEDNAAGSRESLEKLAKRFDQGVIRPSQRRLSGPRNCHTCSRHREL